jgi:hypothetical protein
MGKSFLEGNCCSYLKPLATLQEKVFKKGDSMKRLLLVLFAAAVSTLTFAQGSFAVKFDDTGFNYYGGEKGIKTGYIHLKLESEKLTVSLADAPSPMKIQYDEMKQAVGSDGKKKPWTKSVLVDYVKCYGFSDGTKQGATVLHRKSYLAAVMNAYDEALTQLGFSSSPEMDDTNIHVAVYQHGDEAIRVIFRRQGTDITVRMTAV